ncbi:MAG: 16S rRNA (adenine(1518)-N(6)/adenine(1519)-N(6))-dimethyltransferase RsmA [Armatimonadetes bacterium]|nr:16S rRNA (adenine(1518)-N(6)/adenine(1519)-N(6))-dimethyltransferase RsmA [Armatimonadota bacterium]
MGSPEGESSHLPGSAHQGHEAPGTLSEVLARHGLGTKKQFGQHWLTSSKVIDAIVNRTDGLASVLEIGPGVGVITRPMSERLPVHAVEIDPGVIPALRDFAPLARVTEGDALQFDWAGALRELPQPVGIVSNMPYNITGPLLEKVVGCSGLIDRAVLMMQREVGDKILAPVGDRNRGNLSVVIQAVFEVSRVCLVPPGAFRPPPKVESIVLDFRPRADVNLSHLQERVFPWVRRGFVQPRKTLANNLRGSGDVSSVLGELGLSPTIRPHEVPWEAWLKIAEALG